MSPGLVYVVVCRNLENTTAALRHQIQPYVRENYIGKFVDRLPSDLFSPFNPNADMYETRLELTGDTNNAIVIQSTMIEDPDDALAAIRAARSHAKVSQLLSTFYAVGIDLIGIIPMSGVEDICYFLLKSEDEARQVTSNPPFPGAKYVFIDPETESKRVASQDTGKQHRLSNVRFTSTDHIRYQGGRNVSGHNHGCNRGVQIEPNIRGGEGFTVTIHNLDGNHPVWGNNVQMAPKQMRVVRETQSEIELRGFGRDPMGASFSDYGVTVHFKGDDIEKIILHMHDRGVDIEYLK